MNHPVAAAAGSPAGVRTSVSQASPAAGDRIIVRCRSTVNVDPAKASRCTSTRSAVIAAPTGSARLATGRGVHDRTSQDSSCSGSHPGTGRPSDQSLPGTSSSASAASAPGSASGVAVTRSTGPSRKPTATGTSPSVQRWTAASSSRRSHPTSPGCRPCGRGVGRCPLAQCAQRRTGFGGGQLVARERGHGRQASERVRGGANALPAPALCSWLRSPAPIPRRRTASREVSGGWRDFKPMPDGVRASTGRFGLIRRELSHRLRQ